MSPEKSALGQALFWDEQLSFTNSVACGTCHIPATGGVDPRSTLDTSRHPGLDGVLGTSDDISGSPGIHLRSNSGDFDFSGPFGSRRQVTDRRSGPTVNALLNSVLFWDGRADFSYKNPITGQLVLPAWAALESQAWEPLIDIVEMNRPGRTLQDVTSEISGLRPLAIAKNIPPVLKSWIGNKKYEDLFELAFGSPGVDVDRIVMALASYQRTLFSNQTPFDQYKEGNASALSPQEERGLSLFENKAGCIQCHTYPQLGGQQFHYTGVHIVDEDKGRGSITGLGSDDGKMLTSRLRNVSLRAPFFHNGSAETLADVVDFYDRGGNYNHPNKSSFIQPLGLTSSEKLDLVEFLESSLLDERVASESGIFSRPTLRSEDSQWHLEYGTATSMAGGHKPILIFDDSLRSGIKFHAGIANGLAGARTWLLADKVPDFLGKDFLGTKIFLDLSLHARVLNVITLSPNGDGALSFSIPSRPSLTGMKIYFQAFVRDHTGQQQHGATSAIATELLTGQ